MEGNDHRAQEAVDVGQAGGKGRAGRSRVCYAEPIMVHLDLHPELEALLAFQAQARGLALDRYLEDVLTAQARESKPERGTSTAEAVGQIRQLRQGLRLDGLAIKDLINEGRRD